MSGEVTVLEVGGTTEVVVVGVQGPAGPPGESLIGGYLISVTNLENRDLIKFDSATQRWINVKSTDIVNGGNF